MAVFPLSRGGGIMMAVLAFLCRLLVFGLLSLFSTLAAREYDLSLYSRLLISSLQVWISCGCLALYEVCMCLIGGMVSIDVYRNVEEMTPEDPPATDCDVHAPASDEVLSMAPSAAPTEKIVFATARDLRRHVWAVYCLGVLTWCSVFSMDYTLLSASFFFTMGMLFGWAVFSCSQGRENTMSILLRMFYFVMLTLLVGTYLGSHRQILDPETQFASRDAVVAVLIPFGTGIGWMSMPRAELTTTLHSSFFTCCLLSLPLMVIVDTQQFQAIFEAAPVAVLVYLLVIEPLLKAMAIFTLALSLQTGRRLDILIVLLLAVHIDDMLFHHMPKELMAVTVTVMMLLVFTHVICLVSISSR